MIQQNYTGQNTVNRTEHLNRKSLVMASQQGERYDVIINGVHFHYKRTRILTEIIRVAAI